MEELKFLTFKTKKAFNHLKQIFAQAPILQYFNLKRYIQIKTNISGYAIDNVLSQLSSDQLILSNLISSKSQIG